MDIYDQASEREERDRDAAIDAARRKAGVLPYVGHCYFCSERLDDGKRFCDADCRDGYEFENAQRRRQGRR